MDDIEKKLGHERAERIKLLRKHLRYSRPALCKKYQKLGLTVGALQTWEDVRWSGLTEKGAKLLVEVARCEGLKISVEWLMFGSGDNPLGIFYPLNAPAKLSEKAMIAKELQLFHEHNPSAVDTIVADDALAPWLQAGDYVAGKRFFGTEIEQAIGCASIVQTNSGDVMVRVVRSGKDVDLYTLECTNPDTSCSTTKGIHLFSAAPIVWIRKPERE